MRFRTALAWLTIATLYTSGCSSVRAGSKADRLAQDQQWEEAVAAYESLLKQRPDDDQVKGRLENARRAAGAHFFLMGKKSEELGDLNQAVAHMEKAVLLFKGHDSAWREGSRLRRERRVLAERVAEAGGRARDGGRQRV